MLLCIVLFLLALISALFHNLIYAVFGIEEACFFLLAIAFAFASFVLAIILVSISIRLFIRKRIAKRFVTLLS